MIKVTTKKTYTLTIDGKAFEAEFLGKGSFCTAYRVGDNVYIRTSIHDRAKEALSLDWYSQNPYIPNYKRLCNDGKYVWYSVPYFKPLSKVSAKNYPIKRDFKRLMDSFEEHCHLANDRDYYQKVIRKVIQEIPDLTNMVDALIALENIVIDYGGCQKLTIELAYRNTGIDKDGNLVFFDAIFDRELLKNKKE